MTSIHLFQAEKKDFQDVYDLLIQFKHDELEHLDLPKVEKNKLETDQDWINRFKNLNNEEKNDENE